MIFSFLAEIGRSRVKGVCRGWAHLGQIRFLRSIICSVAQPRKRTRKYFISEQGGTETKLRLRPLVPKSAATSTQAIAISSACSTIFIATVGNNTIEEFGTNGNVQTNIAIPCGNKIDLIASYGPTLAVATCSSPTISWISVLNADTRGWIQPWRFAHLCSGLFLSETKVYLLSRKVKRRKRKDTIGYEIYTFDYHGRYETSAPIWWDRNEDHFHESWYLGLVDDDIGKKVTGILRDTDYIFILKIRPCLLVESKGLLNFQKRNQCVTSICHNHRFLFVAIHATTGQVSDLRIHVYTICDLALYSILQVPSGEKIASMCAAEKTLCIMCVTEEGVSSFCLYSF